MVGIERIEYYLPNYCIEAKKYLLDLVNSGGYSYKKEDINLFLGVSGYNLIRVEKEKSRINMIENVFERFSKTYDLSLIDYVIYSTDILESFQEKKVYPLYFINKFNLKNASYLSINQQCGTQLNVLNIGKLLIMQGQAERVLIISSSYKKKTDNRFIKGFAIAGDGAVGVIIKKSEQFCIKDFITVVCSEYYDLRNTPSDGINYLKYLNNGLRSIRLLLERNKLLLDDINQIIPQNVNSYEWDYYCKKISYPKERVFLRNISQYGHIGDCD